MKKVICALLSFLMLTTVSFTVFAKEARPSSGEDRAAALTARLEEIEKKADQAKQKQEKFANKQEAWDEFHDALNAKKLQMQENKVAMLALKKEILTLKKEIQSTLAALKEADVVLTQEQTAQVQTLRDKMHEIISAVSQTKGCIKEWVTSNKENIKLKDYAAMDTCFDKVYETQNFRLTQLTEEKNCLQSMLDLLKSFQ